MGALLVLYINTAMTPIPFLTPPQKERFLRDHEMITDSCMSEEEKKWLETINFHYFIGYARNYRALVGRGLINKPKYFCEIRSIIESEVHLSAFMMPWLRKAEWNLRALTVKHFCKTQEHGEGYLNTSTWLSHTDCDREQLQSTMLRCIHRHPERYVVEHIKNQSNQNGLKEPPQYSYTTHDQCLALVQELPLWAVIDSFSIGTLSKFIMLCGTRPKDTDPVWKHITQELGISAQRFSTTMEGFGVTRNLIFHHQRLWMRPMPKSPGISNDLQRRYRNHGFKKKNKQAHFIALISVSQFLPQKEQKEYLSQLEKVVAENELFELGVIQSPFPTK